MSWLDTDTLNILYKNIIYKNVEAQIQDFYYIELRTLLNKVLRLGLEPNVLLKDIECTSSDYLLKSHFRNSLHKKGQTCSFPEFFAKGLLCENTKFAHFLRFWHIWLSDGSQSNPY